MKKIIRLTESELRGMISNAVNKIIKEDVLGNDWNVNREDSVLNNYEPFEDQERLNAEEDFRNNHDWGGVGEEEVDPSYYEDIDGAIGWNDANYNPSDNDLYSGRA